MLLLATDGFYGGCIPAGNAISEKNPAYSPKVKSTIVVAGSACGPGDECPITPTQPRITEAETLIPTISEATTDDPYYWEEDC